MRPARLQQGSGAFDGLQRGGERLLRIEPHLHAALGRGADVAERERGAAGSQHHAGAQPFLVHDGGLADRVEQPLHGLERLRRAAELVDEGHALSDFDGEIRDHGIGARHAGAFQPAEHFRRRHAGDK